MSVSTPAVSRASRADRASRAGWVTAALPALGPLAIHAHLWALGAAGLTGTKPQGGDALSSLITTLQSNWEWLIGTGIGLAMMIVVGLVIFGSQRAPEHVFRIAGGVVGLLVVIPAVLK